MSFNAYQMSFYGPDGVYPLQVNESQAHIATEIYKNRLARRDVEFVGDSVDREAVRDIILEARENILPEFKKVDI